MVDFKFSKKTPYESRCWTVTVTGEADSYLNTLHALINLLPVDPDMYNRDQCYAVCSLLEAMLPSEEQLSSLTR